MGKRQSRASRSRCLGVQMPDGRWHGPSPSRTTTNEEVRTLPSQSKVRKWHRRSRCSYQ